MPVETRYMRNDETLGLDNTTAYDPVSISGNGSGYFQIRVRSESGVIVDWTSSMLMAEDWSAIELNLNIPKTKVQNLFVDVKVVCGSSSQIVTFSLLGLNAFVLGNWNFYLWGLSFYYASRRLYYAYFRYGDATYNSRIENFEYAYEEEKKAPFVRPNVLYGFAVVYIKRKRRIKLRRCRSLIVINRTFF